MTWDDAQMLAVEMVTDRGTADAIALGVTPRTVRAVLAH
jgi:NADH dehydrogenase